MHAHSCILNLDLLYCGFRYYDMSEDPPAELRARQERAVIESSVSKTRSARVISLSFCHFGLVLFMVL